MQKIIMTLPFFDTAVMDFVQQNFHNPVTDAVFPALTYLGEYGMIWIVAALCMLFFKKSRTCGMLCLCALAAAYLFGEVFLKNVIGRARPFESFPDIPLLIPPPESFSFPSGHSASSFTAAVVIFWYNKKAGTAALVLAALIAFSRVFLFVHYPTDIIAGAVLGTFFGILTIGVYKLIYRKKHGKAPKQRQ